MHRYPCANIMILRMCIKIFLQLHQNPHGSGKWLCESLNLHITLYIARHGLGSTSPVAFKEKIKIKIKKNVLWLPLNLKFEIPQHFPDFSSTKYHYFCLEFFHSTEAFSIFLSFFKKILLYYLLLIFIINSVVFLI